MADNYTYKDAAGSSATAASDDIGGVHYPRVKISQGADGAATDVSSAAPLNVTLANTGANATPVVVDLGANNDVTVTGTVTANIAAGTNNIGDVDVLTVNGVAPAFGSGARGATVQRVTIATDDTVLTTPGGNVAHDTADSGSPVKVGAKASATLSDDTMVANGDRTDATSDLDGAILVRGQFPLGDLLSEAVSNTDGTSTAFTTFGATASTRSYITAYSIFRTDSGTTPIYVDFRDGTAGSVLYRVVIPPNGGANLASSLPLFRTTANTALAFDVSAATTTVYISVSGFKSKV